MKKIFLAPILGLALVACGNTTKGNGTDSAATDSTAATTEVATATVEGTFTGILPAADNPGFDTTLDLKADGTFVMQQTADGKDIDSISGTYTLAGDSLTLVGTETKYALLRGDSVSFLDLDRNPTVIPYVLHKANR